MPDDPSYYALRNVIWATGSRIVHSKTANSFSETWRTAWGWFENALSVHTEIIFLGSFMTVVQVLILMVRTLSLKRGSNIGAVVLNYFYRHIIARAWARHRCNTCSVPMPCDLPAPKDYIDNLLVLGIFRRMMFRTGTGCSGLSIA